MDNKNFAIGILSTTAVILFVGLVVVQTRPAPAVAAGMANSGGDYELAVGSMDRGEEEVVYVIDAPQQRLVTYRFNANSGTVEILQGVDLTTIRGGDDSGQPQQPHRGGRGRRP